MKRPVSSPQNNGMAKSLVKTIKRDYARLALRPDARTVMQHDHVHEKGSKWILSCPTPKKLDRSRPAHSSVLKASTRRCQLRE